MRALGVLTLFVLPCCCGCIFRPLSGGDAGQLVVVADDIDRPILEQFVASRFGRIIQTPQPEPLFTAIWTDADGLPKYTRSPLILLAATIDGSGSTADLLRRMLTPEVESGLREGRYSVFNRRDPWAAGQLLLILAARDQRELGARAVEWCDSLYIWGLQFERRRQTEELFARGEQVDEERRITERHGFRIRIQHDYIQTQDNKSLNFIRYIRHGPERWIMVAWGVMGAADSLTAEFIYQRRKALGGAFLDAVVCYDDRWQWESGAIGQRGAILVRGLWATVGPTGGGPFFSYGMYVPEENRYYIIDGAVLAPGEAKMPYLWQLDVIARTFVPPSDL